MDNDNDEIITKHTQMFRIHSEITVVMFHLKNLEEKSSVSIAKQCIAVVLTFSQSLIYNRQFVWHLKCRI